MTRTAEIRDRLTDDNRIASWITELLSRLPLEDSQPDTPAFRFAETVKVNRYRMRYAVSEPWFDRTTPTIVPASEPPPRQRLPLEIHYEKPVAASNSRRQFRKVVNHAMACWWRLTGRGTARVAWSID